MTLLEDKNSVCSGFFFQRQGEWTHFTREEGEEAQCIFLLVLYCKTVAAFLRVWSSWANNDNECSTANQQLSEYKYGEENGSSEQVCMTPSKEAGFWPTTINCVIKISSPRRFGFNQTNVITTIFKVSCKCTDWQ